MFFFKYLPLLTFLVICQFACQIKSPTYDIGTASKEDLEAFNGQLDFSLKESVNNPKLQIEFSFNAPKRNTVYLHLPSSFLKESNLYKRIINLKLLSQGSMEETTTPNIWMVKKANNDQVKIAYDIEKGEKPKGQESFFAPIIRNDFWQMVGAMGLVLPTYLFSNDINNDSEFELTINAHLPVGFSFFHSFGAQENKQKIKVSLHDLRDSLFLAGKNINRQKILIRDKPVYITFNGEWELFNRDDLAKDIAKLINIQRKVFNDDDFPYYLVNILELKDNCQDGTNFAGTAHKNAFRAYYPKKCPLSPAIKQLISHELVHTWIGKKIRVGKKRAGVDGKWFTEGFADYYGRILALKAGVISPQEYFISLGNMITHYYNSKENRETFSGYQSRAYTPSETFEKSTNNDLEQLPYEQGEILAHNINYSIKQKNKKYSLSNAILDMLSTIEKEKGFKIFSMQEIDYTIAKYNNFGITPFFKYILHGDIMFAPDQLQSCALLYKSAFPTLRDEAQCISLLY